MRINDLEIKEARKVEDVLSMGQKVKVVIKPETDSEPKVYIFSRDFRFVAIGVIDHEDVWFETRKGVLMFRDEDQAIKKLNAWGLHNLGPMKVHFE